MALFKELFKGDEGEVTDEGVLNKVIETQQSNTIHIG